MMLAFVCFAFAVGTEKELLEKIRDLTERIKILNIRFDAIEASNLISTAESELDETEDLEDPFEIESDENQYAPLRRPYLCSIMDDQIVNEDATVYYLRQVPSIDSLLRENAMLNYENALLRLRNSRNAFVRDPGAIEGSWMNDQENALLLQRQNAFLSGLDQPRFPFSIPRSDQRSLPNNWHPIEAGTVQRPLLSIRFPQNI